MNIQRVRRLSGAVVTTDEGTYLEVDRKLYHFPLEMKAAPEDIVLKMQIAYPDWRNRFEKFVFQAKNLEQVSAIRRQYESSEGIATETFDTWEW